MNKFDQAFKYTEVYFFCIFLFTKGKLSPQFEAK